MPRRSRRRYARGRPLKTVKYSNETMNFGGQKQYNTAENSPTLFAPIIAAVTTQGMRKCKNFTLHIETTSSVPIAFALIYLPQGQVPENQILNFGLQDAPSSIYEPNQNVILSGVVQANSPQLTFRTRLARNLNSGDSIYILYRQLLNVPAGGNYFIYCSLNYAITY
uniref:Cap n=1 Tax=CRESS DNA virus TaxID=3138951 RepID=A0AAU8H6G6_9VIRU